MLAKCSIPDVVPDAACRRTCRASRALVPPNSSVALAELLVNQQSAMESVFSCPLFSQDWVAGVRATVRSCALATVCSTSVWQRIAGGT